MASRRGSVAKFLFKWLIIPVGLAAIGFFVVGPMIGRHVEPTPQSESGPSEPAVDETPSGTKIQGNPEVEVTARPASSRRRSSSRRRTQTRRVETPPPAPAPEIPSPDEEPPQSQL